MPTDWKWPRPETCCVCGAQATSRYKVDCTNLDERHAGVREKNVRVLIPHCDGHKHGVAYDDALGTLTFRSFDCWREFCLLNNVGNSGKGR
jgi:hypothetical protein